MSDNLRAFGFDNYRIFNKETMIELKPITILTGPNSSGKSTVIKAAKLLKQNTSDEKYSGVPKELNFIPDDYGHYLGDYKRIINNKNVGKKENITFILPINLITLGENLFCKLEYGYGPVRREITLLSFTLLKYNDKKKKEIFKLFGGEGEFYEMIIDFSECKKSLENVFIPLILKLDLKSEDESSLINVINYHKRNDLPGNSLIKAFSELIKDYDNKKPILPYYNLIAGDIRMDVEYSDQQELLIEIEETLAIIREEYLREANKSDARDLRLFFKNKEEELFKFINKKKLSFPIELDTNEKSINWHWNGLVFSDHIDEEWETSEETRNGLIEFDQSFAILMGMYDFSNNLPGDDPKFLNTRLFYDYIKYIIIESMEQCRANIANSSFFDSNRIEQVLFYHSNNSKTGYNLVSDFINKNGNERTDKIDFQLKQLSIGEGFQIKKLDFGIYTIDILSFGHMRPLSEFGFGISKLFFLLLAINTYDRLFIEEPETNLHPDLQAKLAVILVDALKDKKKQFIIETHSEYLIRKLQYMVATNKIDKDSVLINYFNASNEREKEGLLKQIKIKRDGSLDGEFGKGFYDEASNIIQDLFKTTYYN